MQFADLEVCAERSVAKGFNGHACDEEIVLEVLIFCGAGSEVTKMIFSFKLL